MATVKQYVNNMKPIARQIGAKYGSSVADKTLRVVVLTLLTMLAVVIKLLVDKGVFTDAELLSAANAAGLDVYDDEPVDAAPFVT